MSDQYSILLDHYYNVIDSTVPSMQEWAVKLHVSTLQFVIFDRWFVLFVNHYCHFSPTVDFNVKHASMLAVINAVLQQLLWV